MRFFITFVSLLFFFKGIWAEEVVGKERFSYIYPIVAKKDISGNFGELRANHFHGGMDFRSEEVEGKHVLAVQDGWISRMVVSTTGYGKALYVSHSDGHTSVYGHLRCFAKGLDSLAYYYQCEKRGYNIDLSFPPNAIPVYKGEVIAFSGNTGASGGPHLHFEIRDSYTQIALNPMRFIPVKFLDLTAPVLRHILIAPVRKEGFVNRGEDYIKKGVNLATKRLREDVPIYAWGKIQIASDAIDRINDNYHSFAVPVHRFFVDGNLISEIHIDKVDFRITRHYNGAIFYPEFSKSKHYYLSSYKQPNCQLDIYKKISAGNGSINIDEERPYHIRYEAEDESGNTSFVEFTIVGKKASMDKSLSEGYKLLQWNKSYLLTEENLDVNIPQGTLFDDMIYSYEIKAVNDSCITPHYVIGNTQVALASPVELIFTIPKTEKVPAEKVYIVSIKNGKKSYVPSKCVGRKVYGKVKEWGAYALRVDTTAPIITPLSVTPSKISFKLMDQESGVKGFEASLDGEFLLLQPNNNHTRVWGNIPNKRLGKPRERVFRIEVKDFCGNMSYFEKKIVF